MHSSCHKKQDSGAYLLLHKCCSCSLFQWELPYHLLHIHTQKYHKIIPHNISPPPFPSSFPSLAGSCCFSSVPFSCCSFCRRVRREVRDVATLNFRRSNGRSSLHGKETSQDQLSSQHKERNLQFNSRWSNHLSQDARRRGAFHNNLLNR